MNYYDFKDGDKLKCVAARNENRLLAGKIYIAVGETQPGIFTDRPYITVKDGERQLTCHASRFEKIT